MADQLHVEVVRAGAGAIAQWRRDNKGVHFDLSGADLTGADLRNCDLTFSDMASCKLGGCDLSGSALSSADLSYSDLTNTKIVNCFLLFTNLSNASLDGAVFDKSNLTGANLRDCYFDQTSFRGTAMTGVDLSETADGMKFEGARLRYAQFNWRFVVASAFPISFLRKFQERLKYGEQSALAVTFLAISGYGAMAVDILRRCLRAISWPVARALGNLTLLTRASYFLLVIVPILAAVWPSVQAVVTQYDDALSRTVVALHVAQDGLDSVIDRTKTRVGIEVAKELAESARELKTRIEGVEASLRSSVVEKPHFPRTFAALFFAALFTALGHFLYQLRADPLVKETTMLEYVKLARAEFNEAGPDANLRLDRARYAIARAAEQFSETVHPHLVERAGGLIWLPSSGVGVQSAKTSKKLMVIERGAEMEYDAAARRAPFTAFFSSALYLSAMALIIWVLFVQSREVLRAAHIAFPLAP